MIDYGKYLTYEQTEFLLNEVTVKYNVKFTMEKIKSISFEYDMKHELCFKVTMKLLNGRNIALTANESNSSLKDRVNKLLKLMDYKTIS